MKRIGLHIIFWFVYLLQDIMLQYTWNMNDHSLDNQFGRAVGTAFISLPAKLLIVYYFVYRIIPKFWAVKANRLLLIAEASVVLIAALFLFRLLGIYFVTPYMYENHFPSNFWYIRDMLVALLQLGYVTSI
ncbi:MAG TPA: hypothetical protein VFI33_18825, partial [Puia sp.]|nr:hypothetical protein [Puia sp.]